MTIMPQLILPSSIENEINQGRTMHFYSSSINGYGRDLIWQLLAWTPGTASDPPGTGTVTMNVFNPNGSLRYSNLQVSNQDINGLRYLGPTFPPQQGGGWPGSGGGGWPGGGSGGWPGGGSGGWPGGGGGGWPGGGSGGFPGGVIVVPQQGGGFGGGFGRPIGRAYTTAEGYIIIAPESN